MPKKHKVLSKCPICKGSGLFELPSKMKLDAVQIKKRIAKELHNKGYSIRQIQAALGYKSPRSIHLILQEWRFNRCAGCVFDMCHNLGYCLMDADTLDGNIITSDAITSSSTSQIP